MPNLQPISSDILNAALEYVDMGFSVIPVRRNNKRPYIKWEEFQRRHPTREEVEAWWEQFPDANVAIICGSISGIVAIDGDGEEGRAWIENESPKTSVYAKTGGGGLHGFYRSGVEIINNITLFTFEREHSEVRVKGEGSYVVASPSIHESGRKYEWIFDGEGWDDLPDYHQPDQKHDSGNLNIDLSDTKEPAILGLSGVKSGLRNITLARLMGRWALYNCLEECLLLAESWNDRCKPPMGRSELEQTVKSIYGKEMKKRAQARILIPSQNTTDTSFPEHLLHPGGLIQDLMQYIDANSPVSVPQFNLASSLAFVGSLVGQKIMTETGLRTNLMCISLGFSGIGKNAPHNALSELMRVSNAYPIKGPTTVTSDSSILRRISEEGQQVTFMLLDEFGHVIKGVKKPLSVEAKIPALLTKLFSGTARGEDKDYANGEKLIVNWHHVSLYATSTPGRFWEDLTPSDFADGFLARANIFESQGGAEEPKPVLSIAPSSSLLDTVNDLYSIEFRWRELKGNLSQLYKVPDPITVQKSFEAKELMEPWVANCRTLQNEVRKLEDGVSAVYGRAAEHASKIALIHHASLNGSNCVSHDVSIDSVRYAIELVDHLTAYTIRQMKENLAANPFDQIQKRVIRYIKNNSTENKPGVSKARLQCDLKIEKKRFNDLLESMEFSGLVFIDHEYKPSRGERPKGGLVCLLCTNGAGSNE